MIQNNQKRKELKRKERFNNRTPVRSEWEYEEGHRYKTDGKGNLIDLMTGEIKENSEKPCKRKCPFFEKPPAEGSSELCGSYKCLELSREVEQ